MNSFDFELYRKMARAIQNIRMMESFRPELEFHKQMQNAGLTPAVLQEIAELNWREELATAAGVHQPHAISPALPVPFQYRVQPWMMATFGTEIAADTAERNHRFLEESLELVRACGCTASEARQLVDYVFGRPVGEPAQEVGGVMVTLAALCLAQGLDMHAAGETELARIWTKVEAIRAKQASKPKHSPLPAAAPQVVADEREALADQDQVPYLIYFDDVDRKPEMIIGGARAQYRFQQISGSWNAHLFVKISSNSSDDKYPCATLAAAPVQANVTELDCPACGGSGHAGDVAARSAP